MVVLKLWMEVSLGLEEFWGLELVVDFWLTGTSTGVRAETGSEKCCAMEALNCSVLNGRV